MQFESSSFNHFELKLASAQLVKVDLFLVRLGENVIVFDQKEKVFRLVFILSRSA